MCRFVHVSREICDHREYPNSPDPIPLSTAPSATAEVVAELEGLLCGGATLGRKRQLGDNNQNSHCVKQ